MSSRLRRGAWPVVRVVQWLVIIGLLVVSEVVEIAGHTAASWVVDGVNLVVYLAFRTLRRRGFEA